VALTKRGLICQFFMSIRRLRSAKQRNELKGAGLEMKLKGGTKEFIDSCFARQPRWALSAEN